MSRPAIIKLLKEKHPKLNKIQIETVVDTFFQGISKALENQQTVFLRGFGTFFVKKIKEKYNARNPATSELIYVPEKNKVRFRPSQKFKELLNK